VTSAFLQKAEIGAKSAQALLALGDTGGACSRAYYAMYDAARATLAWVGHSPEHVTFRTHHGLLAAFARHLVKPGLFPPEPGRAIQRVQALRQLADYEATPIPYDKAVEAVQAAASFVSTAAALIAGPYPPPPPATPPI
jgi:uncharacterized protein (UPF0332 family)